MRCLPEGWRALDGWLPARAGAFVTQGGLQERAKLESELQGLACEQEGQRLYHHVQNEIRGLETKVALLEQEIQADKVRLVRVLSRQTGGYTSGVSLDRPLNAPPRALAHAASAVTQESAAQGRTAGNGVETQAMEKKRQEIEPQVEKLRGKVESQQSRVERIRKRMNEVEDRIFAPLSKEVRDHSCQGCPPACLLCSQREMQH